MGEQEIASLEDIWPLQAELNKKAGFDTRGLGEALLGQRSLRDLEHALDVPARLAMAD